MRGLKLIFAFAIIGLLIFSIQLPLTQGAQPPPYTRLISRLPTGEVGNGLSEAPSITTDGRYVAFQSAASDLVPNDTNGVADIFVYDRRLGLMERVSVGAGATEANGDSLNPSISPDGVYVVFESVATNLVANDTNALKDIFLYNRTTDTITRVNVGLGGVEATGGESTNPHLSNNADRVVYASDATNLIAGDNNPYSDVFMYTRASGATTRISVPSSPSTAIPNGASNAPYISSNGSFVVFASVANNLVQNDNNDACGSFSCSDIFLRDVAANTTSLVSLSSDETQGNAASTEPSVSNDGRYIVYESDATNMDQNVPDTNLATDIFLRDRTAGTTRRVNLGAGNAQAFFPSTAPRISQDGNWIVFSTASDLVSSDTNGYTDIYRFSRANSSLLVASLPEGGGEANESSDKAELSGDGQRVAFWSDATNLTANDTNGAKDVFVRTYLEDDATPTPTNTPTSTATPTNTTTATATVGTATPTNTPGGGPPTMTPTGGAVTRTPTRTRTPWNGGDPVQFLPLIRRAAAPP